MGYGLGGCRLHIPHTRRPDPGIVPNLIVVVSFATQPQSESRKNDRYAASQLPFETWGGCGCMYDFARYDFVH
jgi:hypothetical protein